MAITNFIPTVWSETLLRALDRKYVGVAHCNREFEGEIKEKGNSVKICGIYPISVANYTKNNNMSNPQVLTDICRELKIDQAKYFNFQIDDIDLAQASPRLMNTAMKSAADSLANAADRYVFSLYDEAGTTITKNLPTAEDVLDVFLQTRTQLLKNGVADASDIVYEITPEVSELLFRANIQLASDNGELLKQGYIGKLLGSEIFVTNNVNVEINASGSYHHCIARSKRAIAFAEQLSEMDAYRPELRFADAMKGLHLYGAKTVFPEEMVHMNFVFEGVPED